MRSIGLFSLLLVLMLAACNRQPAQPAPPAPEYNLDYPIEEIMEHIIMPTADALWNSVQTNVTAKGIEEKAPHTDDDWDKVRHYAVTMVEATNLLIMPGRKVAAAGDKSQNPGIELEPEKMEALINQDRKSFVELAGALHDTMVPVIKAIDNKDPQEIENLGDSMDRACENYHLKYWYPNEARRQ